MELSLGAPFAELCRIACALFSVPAALIYLGGNDGARLEACHGLAVDLYDMLASFGGMAGTEPLLIVDDAMGDRRFDSAPLVVKAPSIRFYAEVSICPEPGVAAGRLCLLDSVPRSISPAQREQLLDLARIAAHHLKLSSEVSKASEQEAAYRLLADNSTDTIVRGNLDGVRLYISPSVRTLLGYEPEELIGRRASEIVHPEDAAAFREMMTEVMEGRIDLVTNEQRQRHKDGSWVWLEASLKVTRDKITGAADGYVVSVRNIARRKEAESRLAHIAVHDPLTGLPNRLLFYARLDEALSHAARSGQGFVLLCLDLDRFKPVNDSLGHPAGDAVLRAAAARFRAAVHSEDTVARLGGDEFAIIQTTGGDLGDAARCLAAGLIDAMREPIAVGGALVQVGVSIGIAIGTPDNSGAEGLVQTADRALYEAKKQGRNTYRLSNATSGA